jgi:hypothetical protein
MHLSALELMPQTIEWLLKNVDVDKTLSSSRNVTGYTALEALQDRLEEKRTRLEHGFLTGDISDRFEGFLTEVISTLAAVNGLQQRREQ